MVKIKRIIAFIILIIFITLLIVIYNKSSNKQINNIKKFISSDIRILYISNQNQEEEYINQICDQYELSCLFIDTNNLNKQEIEDIIEIVNNENINSTISFFVNGKLIETNIDITTNEQVDSVLERLKIIPSIKEENEDIISLATQSLTNENKTIIQVIYDYDSDIEQQKKIISSICSDYDIEYVLLNAYTLSITQKNKLNDILNLSSVNNQVLIAVEKGKIVGNIRDILTSKYKYIKLLTNIGIISKSNVYYNSLTYKKYKEMISSKHDYIITLGQDSSKGIDNLKETINDMVFKYEIDINYLNLDDLSDDELLELKESLFDIGYNDELKLPITLIVSNDYVIDTIFGNSELEYFVEIFTENGIIK